MTSNEQKRSKTIVSHSNDDVIIDKVLNKIRNNSKLMLNVELPFICNLGIPIKNSDGHIQCLCSPSHYGDYCEFQADRISIVMHLSFNKYNGNYTINNNNKNSIPFVIQIIAITLLIVWAAKSRARTTSSHTNGFSQILRKQFQTQKELYITPSVIIFAALPQLIFTSSFVCTVLNYAWQRYGLLIAYLFSFIPQLCGFFIFVLPSSSYITEFKKTKIDQTLLYVKKKNNQNNNHTRPSLITSRQQTRPQKKLLRPVLMTFHLNNTRVNDI